MEARRTKYDWSEIVKDFEKSGKTQTVYSAENGFSAKSLSYYVRKARNQMVKRSSEEWRVLIEEQQASGMSRAAWCKDRGINSNAMNSAEKRSNVKLQKAPEPKWLELNPVKKTEPELSKNEEECWGIKIRGAGIEIEVNSNYPVEKLMSLVERLVKQ